MALDGPLGSAGSRHLDSTHAEAILFDWRGG